MIEQAITDDLGPRAMASKLVVQIAELEQCIAAAPDTTQAKGLRKHLKISRQLLKFCKTRAGY